MNKPIGIGLFGKNGHQIFDLSPFGNKARLVASAGGVGDRADCEQLDSLEELLAHPGVDLVILCSPKRSEQAEHAVQSLKAGKHVYAEKPCAFTEESLDRIIATARSADCEFHEMAGTVVQEPYRTMRGMIEAGEIGDVVQVFAQKSYPWHDGRPWNEEVDGGLARQVGIYIMRFVEHIAMQEITGVSLEETALGNPRTENRSPMACSFAITLASGGLASGICNYLNPAKGPVWGYEMVRVFGTKGILETCPLRSDLQLFLPGNEPRRIPSEKPSGDYFAMFLDHLLEQTPMPLPIEAELRPTRNVIRATSSPRI